MAPSAPPPCVDSALFALNAVVSGGSTVTITGINFALPARGGDYTATAAFAVQPCRTTSWTSSTSALCQVADLSNDQVAPGFCVYGSVRELAGAGGHPWVTAVTDTCLLRAGCTPRPVA